LRSPKILSIRSCCSSSVYWLDRFLRSYYIVKRRCGLVVVFGALYVVEFHVACFIVCCYGVVSNILVSMLVIDLVMCPILLYIYIYYNFNNSITSQIYFRIFTPKHVRYFQSMTLKNG
jgi:hypothetical protein